VKFNVPVRVYTRMNLNVRGILLPRGGKFGKRYFKTGDCGAGAGTKTL